MNYTSSLTSPCLMMTCCSRNSSSLNCMSCTNCMISHSLLMSMDPSSPSESPPSLSSPFSPLTLVPSLYFCWIPIIFSIFIFRLCFFSCGFAPDSATSLFPLPFSLLQALFQSQANCKSFYAVAAATSLNLFDSAIGLQCCSSSQPTLSLQFICSTLVALFFIWLLIFKYLPFSFLPVPPALLIWLSGFSFLTYIGLLPLFWIDFCHFFCHNWLKKTGSNFMFFGYRLEQNFLLFKAIFSATDISIWVVQLCALCLSDLEIWDNEILFISSYRSILCIFYLLLNLSFWLRVYHFFCFSAFPNLMMIEYQRNSLCLFGRVLFLTIRQNQSTRVRVQFCLWFIWYFRVWKYPSIWLGRTFRSIRYGWSRQKWGRQCIRFCCWNGCICPQNSCWYLNNVRLFVILCLEDD